MALFECPECGGKVSDKAIQCPHCGCPIDQPQKQSKTCPECGQEVDTSVMVCPNCAFPFEVLDKEEINIDVDSIQQMNINERKNPVWKGLLLLLIIRCCSDFPL